MRTNRLVAGIALALAFTAYADVEWLAMDYDMGTFQEDAGLQSGSVRFRNLGPDSVYVRKVTTSCGCTAAECTDGIILPGDTAFVSFTYNPKMRPGRFNKKVKVFLGESAAPVLISLHGTVIGNDASLAKNYPVARGALRLSTDSISLKKVEAGYSTYETITGYNQSTIAIHPKSEVVSDYLKVTMPDSVLPGDSFVISFYFNAHNISKAQELEIPVKLFTEENPEERLSALLRVRVCQSGKEIGDVNIL